MKKYNTNNNASALIKHNAYFILKYESINVAYINISKYNIKSNVSI